jgi:UDP-glucose 4-epimerase
VRVVLTGGSGQLGSLVLARLIADRHVKRIVSLDLVPPILSSGKLEWKIADVRDPGLERHFEQADALVHLAFIVARRAPAELMRAVNVEASKKMFAHAVDHGLGSILFVSSVAVYGLGAPHPEPLLESSPRRPTPWLPYAETQEAAERELDGIERQAGGARVVRLRPGIAIGRRTLQPLGKALERGLVTDVGPGRLPIVWDDDVADAVMLALHSGAAGAYNLVADDPLPLAELCEAAGIKRIAVPRAARAGLGKLAPMLDRAGKSSDPAWLLIGGSDLVVSSERARAELGWKPACPTARSVAERFASEVPRRTDRRVSVFMQAVNLGAKADRAALPEEAKRMSLTVHLDLTGPHGGDFVLSLDQGRLGVRRGLPRPPDSVIRMSSDTLLALLSGKTDLSAARMTGKVRLSGDPGAGFLLGAVVTGFRNAAAGGGLRGWSLGKLSAWFERSRS